MRTSNIKFTGMMSGLDTDSIVQSLTMSYKNKVDTSKQDQKLLEMKKDAWKEMNTKIYNFHSKYLNAARLESTFNKKEVTISNPNILKINKKDNVPAGTHTIKVDQMAKGATVHTTSIKDKLVDGKKTTLDDLGITTNGSIEIALDKTGTNTKTINADSTMTIEELETKFKEAGVNATFDVDAGAFIISSKDTGADQVIDFTGSTVDLSKLGIGVNPDTNTYKFEGANAKVTYNGGVTIESATNDIKINGLEFTVTGVTSETVTISSVADKDATFDFLVEFVNEYNKLIEDINTKVDAESARGYKPLTDEQKKEMSEDDIKAWEKKITDSIFRNDPTLKVITEEMRNTISNASIVDPSDPNKRISLADMGIATSTNWREKGKLHIDEEKLRKAIDENADAIQQLFTQSKTPVQLAFEAGDLGNLGNTPTEEDKKNAFEALSADKKKLYQDMGKPGIGKALYDNLTNRLKGTTDKSSNSFFTDKLLDRNIASKKEEVSKLEEQLIRMEDLYYKKFTAMEKALAQLNSQSSALMQQLGGM